MTPAPVVKRDEDEVLDGVVGMVSDEIIEQQTVVLKLWWSDNINTGSLLLHIAVFRVLTNRCTKSDSCTCFYDYISKTKPGNSFVPPQRSREGMVRHSGILPHPV